MNNKQKCSQCDEIRELKKDIYDEIICHECIEQNEDEHMYMYQDR